MKKFILISLVDDFYYTPSKKLAGHELDLPEFLACNFGCNLKGSENKFFHNFKSDLFNSFDMAGMPDVIFWINSTDSAITSIEDYNGEVATYIISNSGKADTDFQILDIGKWYDKGLNTTRHNSMIDPAVNNWDEIESEYQSWLIEEIETLIQKLIEYAKV